MAVAYLMIKREIISRESKYYKLVRFRWILYLLILAFFMQRLFLAGIIKNKYQKEYLAEMDKEGVLSYEYIQPKWLDKAPKFLKPYFESWGSYSIEICSERSTIISCFEELSYFDNIKVFSIVVPKNPYTKGEPLALFTALSKFKNIEELSLDIDFINPEHIKLISHLKLNLLDIYSECLSEGSFEIISTITSLKNLDIHSCVPTSFKELSSLKKLDLQNFSYTWGEVMQSGPIIDSYSNSSPILDYFDSSKSLKTLKLWTSLSSILKNIENFPALENLFIGDCLVRDDKELEKLPTVKSIKFDQLKIGPGVTAEKLELLNKVNGLEILNIPNHHDLSFIDFDSFKSPIHVLFPDYFDLKSFLKTQNKGLKISSIFSPGTVIDLETAKLIKSLGIRGIFEEENSLTREVKSFLRKNGMLLTSMRRINPKERFFAKESWKEEFLSLELYNKKIINDAKEKDSKHLELSFNHFSERDAKLLLTIKNLESLVLSIEKGVENLNYLSEHEKLKSVKITSSDLPRTPILLPNIIKLELYILNDFSLNKYLLPEKFTKLRSLTLYGRNVDLSGIEMLQSLRELDLDGDFRFNEKLDKIRLEKFIYYGNEMLQSLRELDLDGDFRFNEKLDKIRLEKFIYYGNGCGIFKNIVARENAKDFYIVFSGQSSSEHFLALKPYASSIGFLDLSETNLKETDFDLIAEFQNLEDLVLPFSKKILTGEDIKNILKLPKLNNLYFGAQKLPWREYKQLSEEDKSKLQNYF